MKFISGKENIYWTEHSWLKMRQYRLSESRVKRVLRFPKRLEVGVAPDTVAGMQPAGSKKHPYEIWVMWARKTKDQKLKIKNAPHPNPPLIKGREREGLRFNFNKITIISAWKYPGTSPVHEPPPIPDDVWEMIKKDKKKAQS